MNVAANMFYHTGGKHGYFSSTVLINQIAVHMLNKETQLHNYAIAKAMRQNSSMGFSTALLVPNRPQVCFYILLN